MLLATTSRAAGPRDRSRRVGVDGEEEAGGLLLMAHASDARSPTTSTPTSTRTSTRRLLRFITCGSVDDGKSHADRPAAVRVQAACSTISSPRSRRDSAQGRHPGRRPRLRAAGRRPGRRARAGDHDRRRLPLLLHRPAQVHRRRHARPRAVHAQHGHRRLDRGRRGDPDRRPQGRADPDAAARYLVSLLGIRHVVLAVNKMDLVDYSQERFDESSATTARSPRRSASTTSRRSRCRRCTATT